MNSFSIDEATDAEVTNHGFDRDDYAAETKFYVVKYIDGRSGIITESQGSFHAICYNEDEIFSDANAAAKWLGRRIG